MAEGERRYRGQDKPEATSANVVHSAARQRSMLCRSTTYRAHQRHETVVRERHPRIGQGAWPACRGVVGDGTASAVADRSAQFTAPSWQCHRGERKCSARRPRSGRRPARPPHPGRPGSARTDEGAYRVWGGREGAVGNQECQESVMQVLRVTRGRATPEGRWVGCGGATRGGHGHKERRSQNRC